MFNRLNDNLLRIIYEYDPTYKHIYNIVLEEFKIKCVLKFKHKFNINSVKEWNEKITRTTKTPDNLEHPRIRIKKQLLKELKEILKQTNADETIINITEAINQKQKAIYVIFMFITADNTRKLISFFKLV